MERLARPLGFRDLLARHDHDNPTLADDFAFLTELGGAWKPKMDRLRRQGPTNIAGGLFGLVANPITANAATVTGGATELVMIPTTLFPVEQNVQSGKLYLLYASGTSTTAATPGTYTLAARIGPAPTNASPLFGAVSGSFTPIASATAAQWQMQGFVLIRGSGTANTAVGTFEWTHSATIGGGGPSSVSSAGPVGGISASFDSTGTTCALWIGVTHATSTTNTWVPQFVGWASAN